MKLQPTIKTNFNFGVTNELERASKTSSIIDQQSHIGGSNRLNANGQLTTIESSQFEKSKLKFLNSNLTYLLFLLQTCKTSTKSFNQWFISWTTLRQVSVTPKWIWFKERTMYIRIINSTRQQVQFIRIWCHVQSPLSSKTDKCWATAIARGSLDSLSRLAYMVDHRAVMMDRMVILDSKTLWVLQWGETIQKNQLKWCSWGTSKLSN